MYQAQQQSPLPGRSAPLRERGSDRLLDNEATAPPQINSVEVSEPGRAYSTHSRQTLRGQVRPAGTKTVKAQVPLVVPRCTKLPRRRQLLSAQQGFTLLLFPVLRCTTLYRDPGKQKVLLKHPSLSGFPVLPQRCPGLTPSPLSSADFPV